MILITGTGGICAAGSSILEIAASFRTGKRAGGLLTLFPSDLDYPVFQVESIPAAWDRPGLGLIPDEDALTEFLYKN